MSSSKKGKVVRFHFSVIYLIIVSVWFSPKHPEWKPPAAASSSDLPVWLICLIACSVFLAITQFPSLVCKTALSSGGGIWQQQIQSPGSLSDQTSPYFSDQLLKPRVACCSGHIKNTVENFCPLNERSENNPFDIHMRQILTPHRRAEFHLNVYFYFSNRSQGNRNITQNASPVWTAGRSLVMETHTLWWKDPNSTGEPQVHFYMKRIHVTDISH